MRDQSAQSQSVYLLPPRPRRRDWLSAGLTAGATLGLTELLVAFPGGLSPPPPLGLAAIATVTLLVGVLGLGVGVALEWSGVRLNHSGMVGAMLGPLIGATLPGAVWNQLVAGAPTALGISGLGAVALFALAAGLAGARMCEALENGGVPVSALLVWGATALSMASGERILVERPGGLDLALLLSAPAVALGVVVVGHERARRWSANLVVQPTRALGLMCVAAATAATWPWIAPWVFYDDAMPGLEGSPPSFLWVALDDSDPLASQATLEIISWNGVAYRDVTLGPVPGSAAGGLESWFRMPDGSNLLEHLRETGYVTRVIATSPSAIAGVTGASVDAAPGPVGLLRGRLAWMSVAPLLAGPASAWLDWIGFGGEARSPSQLVDSATSWLLTWRTMRAPSPFFLFIDFRSDAPAEHRAASEAELHDLLDQLDTIGVAQRTTLVGVVEIRGSKGDRLRAALRPPHSLDRSPPDAGGAVLMGELNTALLQIAKTELRASPSAGDFRPSAP